MTSERLNIVLEEAVQVAASQQKKLIQLQGSNEDTERVLNDRIGSTEEALTALGYTVSGISRTTIDIVSDQPVGSPLKSWADLLKEAEAEVPDKVEPEALLSEREIAFVIDKHEAIGQEFDWAATLDRYDITVAVVSGLLAGILDVFLVGVPAHPGFLGGKREEGGWLSNLFKEESKHVLPDDKIKALEQAYKVSYDPSTNSRLAEKVAGLGPRTHRFQSVGHDPVLGLIFGVRDVFMGEFTAIDKFGTVVVQKTADPLLAGESVFVRIAEALETQLGHLASDVSTKAGLPAPLMPLLSFLQVGHIGKHGYTVGEVARQMYRSGYDFRHFLAGSVPVMLSEVIVRLGFFVKGMRSGKSLQQSIPSASSLTVRRQLLIAHSVATLVNAGKVYFTQNPLAISWAQILTLLRYAAPEMLYLLHGKEGERRKLVNQQILTEYDDLVESADKLWLKSVPAISL